MSTTQPCKKRVLVGCEFSGAVRDAFIAEGHDAWSCDLLPTEVPGPHIQGDIFEAFQQDWDLFIGFPPCTHLCVSGARWFKDKTMEQAAAVQFFLALANAPFAQVAIENPIGIMSRIFRKPDQIIQPWHFGHGETKATCFWLRGLPLLKMTRLGEALEQRVHNEPPGPERWRNRSRTFPGIAEAMAKQWSAA